MATIRLFSATIVRDEKTSYNFYIVKNEQKYLLTALTKWYEKNGDDYNVNKKCYFSIFVEKDNFWYPSLDKHIIDCELEINSHSQVVSIKYVDATEDPFKTLYFID